MFSCATLMNCRSVAEHVCVTAARPFPPRRRTSDAMATSATASPAAAEKRGFTLILSAARRPTTSPFRGRALRAKTRAGRARALLFGGRLMFSALRRGQASRGHAASVRLRLSPAQPPALAARSKDEASVRAVAVHADPFVDADRRGVLGADEEADGRNLPQEQAAEVAHPALRVAPVAFRRIDPDLLHLHGGRSPR